MPRALERYVVPKDLAGRRLDEVLSGLLPDLSRSQAQKLVRRGDVLVSGKRVVRSNGRVARGTEIAVERDVPEPAIDVLHEDEELLVVSKPPGLLTHGIAGSDAQHMAQFLEASHGPLPRTRGEERPGVVHRLDRETSGVLVVARTEAALEALQDQFRERAVLKRYLAIVSGAPGATEPLSIDLPLGPVPGKADRQWVDHDRGKDALTLVRLERALGGHSLVDCTIHTGRRHQIRVHLAERGYPVVGDPLSGTKRQRALPAAVPRPPRLALHAAVLAFDHPRTGERLEVSAPLPPDLAGIVEALAAAAR